MFKALIKILLLSVQSHISTEIEDISVISLKYISKKLRNFLEIFESLLHLILLFLVQEKNFVSCCSELAATSANCCTHQ